jgi:serine/threonine-protein kinase
LTEQSVEDLTGKSVGRYVIVAPLGQGSMATVYKAQRVGTDRYVALKILPRRLANDPIAVSRFRLEAAVVGNLRHPNILPLHDFGEGGGYTYIAMPFVENGSLADRLRGEPLPVDAIVSGIAQLADALHHAHAVGVIHRDVKPSNVLLDQYGNWMLTDFGIAKLVASQTEFTAAGMSVGTPTYMSPEQALAGAIDHRSDIYSLGVILYQLATGRVPFRAKTPVATALMHINEPLPPPRTFYAELTLELEEVIVKSLAKRPEDRYATASDFASALLEVMLARG